MSSQILKYKDAYFYSYIKSLIKEYATKHQDRILMKYVDSDSLKIDEILNNLDDEKFLSNDKLEIDIVKFIEEYLVKTKSYIDFKNNKVFILDNLLKNAKGYNEKGEIVDIKLNLRQKEIVIKQYNESFDDEIKQYIENNSDEFEEIFIANNNMQFEKLFPKTYVETLKEQAITHFKTEGVMEAVRYGLAYPEELKSAMSRQYVNNNIKEIKTLKETYSISAKIHNTDIKNIQWDIESAITTMKKCANPDLMRSILYWYDNYKTITPRFFMITMLDYLNENFSEYKK